MLTGEKSAIVCGLKPGAAPSIPMVTEVGGTVTVPAAEVTVGASGAGSPGGVHPASARSEATRSHGGAGTDRQSRIAAAAPRRNLMRPIDCARSGP